eukprot:6077441-Amphidinium_carterae.2
MEVANVELGRVQAEFAVDTAALDVPYTAWVLCLVCLCKNMSDMRLVAVQNPLLRPFSAMGFEDLQLSPSTAAVTEPAHPPLKVADKAQVQELRAARAEGNRVVMGNDLADICKEDLALRAMSGAVPVTSECFESSCGSTDAQDSSSHDTAIVNMLFQAGVCRTSMLHVETVASKAFRPVVVS